MKTLPDQTVKLYENGMMYTRTVKDVRPAPPGGRFHQIGKIDFHGKEIEVAKTFHGAIWYRVSYGETVSL